MHDPYQLLLPDLMPGERVLWTGQPDTRILFTPADRFMVPFSILWCGFAIVWEAGALGLLFFGDSQGGDAPLLFPLFGVPFVLIGLYMVAGRFAYKAYQKRRTLYAVTDKRVLILTLTGRRRLTALFLSAIPSVQKSTRADGTGTITFGPQAPFGSYPNMGLDFLTLGNDGGNPPGFFDIHDVEETYRLILGQRAKGV
jgi:hypothetical protein